MLGILLFKKHSSCREDSFLFNAFLVSFVVAHRCLRSREGVSKSFWPRGHIRYTVALRGSGRLKGFERVPWLGNSDFQICISSDYSYLAR